MRGKKVTNKIIDVLLTVVVITLSITLVTLDVKAYECNADCVADKNTSAIVLTPKHKDNVKKNKYDNNINNDTEDNNKNTSDTDNDAKDATKDTSNENSQVNENSQSSSETNKTENSNNNKVVESSSNNTNSPVKTVDENDKVQAFSGTSRIGRVYINGNVSPDRAAYLNNCCNYIPGSVLNAFDQLGFKIIIGNYNQSRSGLFDSQAGCIYIENNTSMDYAYVLSHEMGHFFDLVKNLTSETGEFKNIFNNERYKLAPRYSKNYNYYTSSIVEYFAECFDQYVTENSKLAKNNPKSYAYIQSNLNTLTQNQINYIGEALKLARQN